MAFDFDGADDLISFGSAAALDDLPISKAFSAHAWINPATQGENGTGRIWNKRTSENGGGWIFFMDGTESLGAQVLSTAAAVRAQSRGAANQCPLGSWHSVVLTYDDNGDRTLHIYVDGAEISYTTQTAATLAIGTDASGNLLLGNNGTGTGATRSFDGSIQEVGVWSRVLALHEIQALAKGFSAKFFGRDAALLAALSRGANDWKGNVAVVTGAVVVPNTHIYRPSPPMVR